MDFSFLSIPVSACVSWWTLNMAPHECMCACERTMCCVSRCRFIRVFLIVCEFFWVCESVSMYVFVYGCRSMHLFISLGMGSCYVYNCVHLCLYICPCLPVSVFQSECVCLWACVSVGMSVDPCLCLSKSMCQFICLCLLTWECMTASVCKSLGLCSTLNGGRYCYTWWFSFFAGRPRFCLWRVYMKSLHGCTLCILSFSVSLSALSWIWSSAMYHL